MPDETHVLIVEDDAANRKLLERLLRREGYDCATAVDGREAREQLRLRSWELVLCDVNLPDESGLDVLKHVMESYEDTAVVMVSGVDNPSVTSAATQLGTYGYVLKPYRTSELLIELKNALRRRTLEIENRMYRTDLERKVDERTREVRDAQYETVLRLSAAVEYRDDETGEHIERVGLYCGALARNIGLDTRFVDAIRIAAPLHDIGKIGLPDAILRKLGPLTAAERVIIERHAEIGYRILAGSRSDVLDLAASIALTHHERLDGSGYPHGLCDDEIPLEGRIAAICDVFDAVSSNRVYRNAMTTPDSIAVLRAGRGTLFDPDLLDVFLASMPEVLALQARIVDVPALMLPAYSARLTESRRPSSLAMSSGFAR